MSRPQWLLLAALWMSGCEGFHCPAMPWDQEPAPPALAKDGGVPAVRPERARLLTLKGEVTLERGTTSGPASPGAVRLGDVLQTGPDGEVEVKFPDGRSLVIGPNARVAFGEQEGTVLVDIARGLVLTRVPEDAKSVVSIILKTPFGFTRLAGELQEIQVTIGADKGEIDVRLGGIQFIGSGGQADANAGERIILTQGKPELIARTPATMTIEPVKVVVLSSSGAELRKKGERRWRRLGTVDVLADGDAVRTKRAPALLRLEGSRGAIEIGSQSEVVIAQAGKAGQRREASVDIKKGRVASASPSGEPTRIRVGDVGIDSTDGGRFSVRRARAKALDVEATVGDLSVQRKEQPLGALAAGQRATVGPKGLTPPSALRAPALSMSARGSQRVFSSGLEEFAISWVGGDGDYRVRVAQDASFSAPLLEGIVHQPRVTLPAPQQGALFWSVEKVGGGEVARVSAVFAPEAAGANLELLRNEVLEGADKTTIFYQDKPPALTFRFKPEEGAAKFKLTLFRTSELSKPFIERASDQSELKLEAGLLAEGSYVWSVEPQAVDGKVLRATGRMNKLEMVYDNAVPQLVVLAPKPGDPAQGKIPVRGIAPLGSRVYINGKPAPLDDKNRFETIAYAVGSPPVIIFKVMRPGEPDTFTVRSLRQGR